MSFKSRFPAVFTTRNHRFRRFCNSQHIRSQYHYPGTCSCSVSPGAETAVQISTAALRQHTGIKLGFIPFPFSQPYTILIVHIAVKLILPCRLVTNGHGNYADLIKHIIQIVSAVRPHSHVRRIQAYLTVPVQRICTARVYDTFITPVTQIVHRGRPTHIVPHAENISII